MLRQLAHRGPDGNGIVELPESVLGQTRLAIVDPGYRQLPSGHNGTWIAFSGEIYNYRELRASELSAMQLQSETDTEVLLELFRRDGPACVEKLDGMFAIAIMHGNDLFLARDPLGIQPLYIGWHNDTLFFASEMKPLQETCTSISEFPAGTWYDTKLGWHQYFQAGTVIKESDSTEAAARLEFAGLLAAAVRQQIRAEVPIGIRLGNGLEDGIIAGLALRESPRLMTFAAGMPGSGTLELARQQAASLGSNHFETIYSEAEIIDALPWIIYHLESCNTIMVRNAVPAYFLAKLASTHAKIMLTGDGGQSIFGNLDYLSMLHDPSDFQRELLCLTGQLHNRTLQWTDRMNLAFGLEVRLPFLANRIFSYGMSLPASWKLHTKRAPGGFLQDTFREIPSPETGNFNILSVFEAAKIATVLTNLAASTISNELLLAERERLQQDWHYRLEDKETLLYFNMLKKSLQEATIFACM